MCDPVLCVCGGAGVQGRVRRAVRGAALQDWCELLPRRHKARLPRHHRTRTPSEAGGGGGWHSRGRSHFAARRRFPACRLLGIRLHARTGGSAHTLYCRRRRRLRRPRGDRAAHARDARQPPRPRRSAGAGGHEEEEDGDEDDIVILILILITLDDDEDADDADDADDA
eukprot:COSAG01_NODE_4513_length_4963_cov_2.746094_3_plen_169_part_00